MDLSKLVSGGGKLSGAWADLAYKIGEVRQWCLTMQNLTMLRAVSVSSSVEAVFVRTVAPCKLGKGNLVIDNLPGKCSFYTRIAQ